MHSCGVLEKALVLCHRAGLYKQLAELKALVAEYREDPAKNAALKVCIFAVLFLLFLC